MAHIDCHRSLFYPRAAFAVALCLAISAADAQDNGKKNPASRVLAGQPSYANGEYPGAPHLGAKTVPGQYSNYQYTEPKVPNAQYPYNRYPNVQIPPGQYRGSQQDQQACIGDVFRLCNQAIPDVSRIVACLQSNRRTLSPPCRAVFRRSNHGQIGQRAQGGK